MSAQPGFGLVSFTSCIETSLEFKPRTFYQLLISRIDHWRFHLVAISLWWQIMVNRHSPDTFTALSLCYQPLAGGPGAPLMQSMMGQPMMGQPMMRPPFTGLAGAAPGAAAPGAPVTNHPQWHPQWIINQFILSIYPFIVLLFLRFLQDLQARAPRSQKTLWQISTSKTSYNAPGGSSDP